MRAIVVAVALLVSTPLYARSASGISNAEVGSNRLPQTKESTASDIQQKFDSFYKFLNSLSVIDHEPRSHLVTARFHDDFGADYSPDKLAASSGLDRHLLFQAAYLASFENPGGEATNDLLPALQSLSDGGDLRKDEIRLAYEALFQARRFGDMSALKRRFPSAGLPAGPKLSLRNPRSTKHMVLSYRDGALALKNWPAPKGPSIVVIAHPLCHFTQHAVAAIEEDKNLERAISNRSIWISPPDAQMDFQPFASWRAGHPEFVINTAYSYESWPEIARWGTPTFYFFKDGKLLDVVEGWPKEGHMGELREGMRKIGLKAGQ